MHNKRRKISEITKQKISHKAKARFKTASNHPQYKAIDIHLLKSEVESGESVKNVCAKYNIHRTTYYKKLKEVRNG